MRCAAWRGRRSCSPSIAARRLPEGGGARSAMVSLRKRAGQCLGLLGALTRWDEWYDQKLPMFLAAVCYAAIIRDHGSETTAWQIVALLVLFCLYAAFGHLVNDYADREADRKAGKD